MRRPRSYPLLTRRNVAIGVALAVIGILFGCLGAQVLQGVALDKRSPHVEPSP